MPVRAILISLTKSQTHKITQCCDAICTHLRLCSNACSNQTDCHRLAMPPSGSRPAATTTIDQGG